VELLAEQFLKQARSRFATVAVGLSQSSRTALHRHDWPGNVRELRSRVYQAVIDCERRFIEPADLGLADIPLRDIRRPLSEIRNRVERDAVQSALLRHERNVAQAAKDLCVSRMTLYRLMEKHGLAVGDPMHGR
jgi:DNA-binding NtrC family response regulator